MKTNLKHLMRLLGIIGLLIVPATAHSDSAQKTAGGPSSDIPRLLLAGSASLLATGNQTPVVENDPRAPIPELIATEPRFAFGRVLEGTVVVHDFLIENRGAGELRIDQVLTG